MTIYAADADLLDDETDTEPELFVPHECVECGRGVPGSPEDCPVICWRCSRDADRI